jgi:hypothetical protein
MMNGEEQRSENRRNLKATLLDEVESQIAHTYHDIGKLHELKNECDTRIAQHRAALVELHTKAAGILAAGDEA